MADDGMVKEFFLAILSFAVTALVIIILMTAAGNLLFPSAVHIVETRLETVSTDAAPVIPERKPAPSVPAPSPEPKSDAPPAGAGPSDAPEPVAGVPVAETGPAEAPDAEVPGADTPQAPSEPPEADPSVPPSESSGRPTEAPAPLSPAAVEQMTDDLDQGEILPLGDGRVAYKVAGGDTFSQICKAVIGSGRPAVWKAAERMMGIDHRTLRPGMVLIFDPPVQALGETE